MSVRRVNTDGFFGYGVTGELKTNANIPYLFDLSQVLKNISFPPRYPPPNNEVIVEYVCYLQWRVKIDIRSVNQVSRKVFDNIAGKEDFGRYTVKVRTYNIDDGFVSYNRFVSKLYGCAFLIDPGSEEEEEIPCDLPPVDLEAPASEGFTWFPQTSRPIGVSGVFASRIAGDTNAEMGDFFTYYPSFAVDTFIYGLTYNFLLLGITAEEKLLYSPSVITI